MIDLYTWTTPNGRKISIMLEEVGLPYRAIPVDIMANELRQLNQLDPKYLGIGADLDQWVTSQSELPASVRAALGGPRHPL